MVVDNLAAVAIVGWTRQPQQGAKQMNPEDLKKSIENQLFAWDGWDQLDTMQFVFYNCILLVSVLGFPAGAEFSSITIDYSNSQIEFYKYPDDEFPIKKGNLKISVVE